MSASSFRRRLRARPAMSPQRRVMITVAVLAVAGALAVIGATTDLTFGVFSVVVTLLALASMGQPDTAFPTVVIGLVVLRWWVSDGSPTSASALAIAAALAAFHTIAALLAAVPWSATVPGEVVRRWVQRWLAVVGVTSVWWAALALLSRRGAGPSSVATVGAIGAVVLGLLVLRRRVVVVDAGETAVSESDSSRIAG